MNLCIFNGRITKDLELKSTPSGTSVLTFSIACDMGKDKDGNKLTEYPNMVAWGKTAEAIAKYFSKGDGILVQSSVRSRSYDAKDGSKKYITEFYVNTFAFPVGKKFDGMANMGTTVMDENIPF